MENTCADQLHVVNFQLNVANMLKSYHHRFYHRRPADPPVITYRRRVGGALEKYEDMWEKEFNTKGGPQNYTSEETPISEEQTGSY